LALEGLRILNNWTSKNTFIWFI